jgi:hypothetical protein
MKMGVTEGSIFIQKEKRVGETGWKGEAGGKKRK